MARRAMSIMSGMFVCCRVYAVRCERVGVCYFRCVVGNRRSEVAVEGWAEVLLLLEKESRNTPESEFGGKKY